MYILQPDYHIPPSEYYSKIWDQNPNPLEKNFTSLLQPVTQNHKMDSRDKAIDPSHKRYKKNATVVL